MKTTLFPTQEEDVRKIANGVDVPNFSKPGTGKTLTTIGVIDDLKLYGGLITCPSIATYMWKAKLEEELGATVQRLDTKKTVVKPADFYVASHAIIPSFWHKLIRRKLPVIVLDECHKAKTPRSLLARTMFGEDLTGKGGLYECSEQFFNLSGTPIKRYANDLWAVLRATQPEILASIGALSHEEFSRQFCRYDHRKRGNKIELVVVDSQNERLLNQMIYEWIGAIRRTKADVAPYMPPSSERIISIEGYNDQALKVLLKGKSHAQIMQMIEEDDMAMSTARRLLGQAKVKGAIDYITEEMEIEPLIAGYWHNDVGLDIFNSIKGRGHVAIINGQTPPSARERIRSDFIKGNLDVIVGQMGAMGEAMDGLQHGCSRVIVIEDDWSPGTVEQFIDRVDRMGQQYPVIVDYLRIDNELEEIIRNVRTNKNTKAGLILD